VREGRARGWTRCAAAVGAVLTCAGLVTSGGLLGTGVLPVQTAAAASVSRASAGQPGSQQPGSQQPGSQQLAPAPASRPLAAGPSSGKPAGTLPPENWIIKSNDLAEIQATGADPGSFQYVGCGGRSDPLRCHSGQVHIYTNFYVFRQAVEGGLTGTVIIDYETWAYTPARQAARPDYFIRRTQRLVARADGRGQDIVTIETPGGKRSQSQLISEDVTAVRAGSPIVEIQSQFGVAQPRAKFRPFVSKAIRAIRKVSKKVTILVGLATDAGGTPVTAREMVRSYRIALQRHAQGFWLNAAMWAPPRGKGCAPDGCPQTAVTFLTDIGAIT
jgi:hypothetical protein